MRITLALSLSAAALSVGSLGPLGCAGHESGSADDSAASADEVRATSYVNVDDLWTTPEDQNRWFQTTRALRQAFDDVCGDTFCEGDYTNLQALSFRCSASKSTGRLKECVWVFAGSYEEVSPQTGKITPSPRTFVCKIPASGTARAFVSALLAAPASDILRVKLPGSTKTTYDALGTCFSGL